MNQSLSFATGLTSPSADTHSARRRAGWLFECSVFVMVCFALVSLLLFLFVCLFVCFFVCLFVCLFVLCGFLLTLNILYHTIPHQLRRFEL